ncbi:hypothetical protein QTP88_007544 [Uroleucon formosanum]
MSVHQPMRPRPTRCHPWTYGWSSQRSWWPPRPRTDGFLTDVERVSLIYEAVDKPDPTKATSTFQSKGLVNKRVVSRGPDSLTAVPRRHEPTRLTLRRTAVGRSELRCSCPQLVLETPPTGTVALPATVNRPIGYPVWNYVSFYRSCPRHTGYKSVYRIL